MKRKFDDTYAESYTETRDLVFNISIGKLRSGSLKPVEPSLWRSLLIIKTLHRITEELRSEACTGDEPEAENKALNKDLIEHDPLEALFCLQNAPVAVYLSDDESMESTGIYPEPVSEHDSAMEVSEFVPEPSSFIMLSTYLPGSSVLSPNQPPGERPAIESSSSNVIVQGFLAEQDNFADIDCSCLDSFQHSDLTDISMSIDGEFLLSVQPAPVGAFSSSSQGHVQNLGSTPDLDSLMKILEN